MIHEAVNTVRAATARLRTVREMLLHPTPELLEECGPALEEAASLMGKIRPSEAPGMTADLEVLRRELQVVQALMQQVSRFYLDWAQILGAAVGGYTAQGWTATVPAAAQISFEG